MKDATRAVVNAYLRKCSWLEEDDLSQEAELAKLEAARTWKAAGAPLEAYQATVIAHTLCRYVWKSRWTVHAPTRHLPEGIDLRSVGLSKAINMRYTAVHPEERLDSERAASMVREALALLSIGDLASEVLLHERKPAAVARARGVSVQQVYRAARLAKRALQENKGLRAFVEC